MGTAAQLHRERRQIRKALGPEAGELVEHLRMRVRAHGAILNRGFFGRLKWLLFGK